MQWCKTGYKQVNQLLDRFSALIWRLLEIHIFKAVAFTVFLVCLEEVRRRRSSSLIVARRRSSSLTVASRRISSILCDFILSSTVML